MLSLESHFLNPGSPQASRLLAYEHLTDSLDVIVPERREHKTAPVRLAGNVLVYPIARGSRLRMFMKMIRTAMHVGRSRRVYGETLIVTSQDPFELGIVAWIVARRLGAALHLQVHTDVASRYFAAESLRRRLQVALARFLLPRADAIRVVSRRIKDGLVSWGISEEQVAEVPIHTPKGAVQANEGENLRTKHPSYHPLILMASRLSPEKNISLAISAFAAFHKDVSSAGLVIVGAGGEERPLKAQTRRLGIESAVSFEPWTNTITPYMKSADMFLLTSNYEGWGMSVVEAATAGLPVIMTDVGCAGEFVINNESGVVVPIGDKEALVAALKHLNDAHERARLSQGAYGQFATLPDEQTYYHAIMTSYGHARAHHESR